jgi:hypothetical protein
MRITLTGRRLALAAVLVLAGALAPIAYSALGKSGGDAARPLASPVTAGSVAAAQAQTSSGDNPYQVTRDVGIFSAGNSLCNRVSVTEDFVLENVTSLSGGYANVAEVFVVFEVITATGVQIGPGKLPVPTDTAGNGTQAFNIYVEPGSTTVGDVHGLFICVTRTTGTTDPASVLGIFTGQRVVTTPSASTVIDFRARRESTGTAVRWTTGSEVEVAGFNVWRYRGAKGVKVNRTLVHAKRSGEPAGASYRYVDHAPGVKRGLTYRLQLVDLKGKRTWYAAFAIASK